MTETTNLTIGAVVDEAEGVVTVTVNGVEVARLTAERNRDGSLKGLLSQRVEYAVVDHAYPEFPFTSESFSLGGVSLSSDRVVHEVSLPVLRSLATAAGVTVD